MTDTIARILSGGAFTRQQADALRQLLAAAAGAPLGALTTADIGVTVQGQDPLLQSIADLATAADRGLYLTSTDTFATFSLTAGGRALGGVAGTANTFPYFSAANTVTLGAITAAGRALIDDANATAQRTTLGLGTMATQNANSVAITGGTIGGVVFNALNQGNGFISWTGEATVTPSTSVALLDSTGAALSPAKTYKVAACNIDSSAQRGAVVLFVGDGSSFTRRVVYEQGTVSSNVQLYLNAGVPSVSVYGGSGSYRIPYRIEEVPNFGYGLSEFGILQRLTDAPSDGKIYGRKDAMWVEAGSGGGKTLKQQEFKTSGTWVRPTGVNSAEVLLVAGGGGGGGTGSSSGQAVGGGGGGGQVIRRIVSVTGNVTVIVGAGGAGGAASSTSTANAGSQGGTSSFGALSAYGGGGGGGGSSGGASSNAPAVIGGGSGGGGGGTAGSPANGIGEASSGGGTSITSSSGANPAAGSGGGAGMSAITGAASGTASTGHGTVGGAGLYGFGGGGGGGIVSPSCYGRGSSGGGNGGYTSSGSNGASNTGGGGGGAGGVTQAGGDGGSGICIVTWWE